MLYRISVTERGLTGIANIFRSRLSKLDDLLGAGTVPLRTSEHDTSSSDIVICWEKYEYVRLKPARLDQTSPAENLRTNLPAPNITYIGRFDGYSLSEGIEDDHIGEGVVDVVGVRWVLGLGPVLGQWRVPIKHHTLRLTLVVYRVEASHLPRRPDQGQMEPRDKI